jgi:NH3-dependent NAD+ synthetase
MISVPFDDQWKKIAVSLSGGADSALLSYLICQKITTQEIHFISHVRCWKNKPWQKYDATNVINWLQKKFPNVKIKRHINFIPPEMEWGNVGPVWTDEYGKKVSGDNIELRAFAEYTCHTNDIDIYFNAVTRNPRDVNFKGMPTRDIDPTSDNQHLLLMKHMDRLAAHPFRFIEKSEIIKEYINQGIEDLLSITRSCEGTFKDITYKNYKPGQYVPICEECFWCKEREWAIEQVK